MIWLSRQKTSGGHSDSIIAQRNNLTNLDIIDDNNIDTPNKTPTKPIVAKHSKYCQISDY